MKRILQLSLWITTLLVVLNTLSGALVGECDLCFANNVACISQQSFVLCNNGAPTNIEVPCPGDKICTSHQTICRSPTEDTPACYENYCGTCILTDGRFACIDETTYGFCFGDLTPKLETFTKCPNGYVCNIEMGNCMPKETYTPSCYKSSEGTESTTSMTSTVTGVTPSTPLTTITLSTVVPTVTTNSVPTTIDTDTSTATITVTTDPTTTVTTDSTTTVTTDPTTTVTTDSTTTVTTDPTTTVTTDSTTTVTTDSTTTVTTDPTTTATTDSTTVFTVTTGNGQSTDESSTVTSSVTADSSSTTVSDISTLTTDADSTTSIITTIASSTGTLLSTLTSMVSQITTTQMTTEIYSTPSTTTTRAPITNPDDFCNYIQAEGYFSLEGDTTCKTYIHCYNLSGDYIGTKYICAGYFNSVTQKCQDEKPTNC
ncbi:cell wall protein DAN4 [Teleopsis dalmanni]|uniref:cell wall protein DAN4 n=1 Tax=Teleopsis dalmanni TaxID=139649 RepID=UPI0018CF85FD|nr:cell wall protein DAN4 [Teleopsis dalmanni]